MTTCVDAMEKSVVLVTVTIMFVDAAQPRVLALQSVGAPRFSAAAVVPTIAMLMSVAAVVAAIVVDVAAKGHSAVGLGTTRQ